MTDDQEIEINNQEINMSYRALNLRNETDENEEGIAEYLDLDLENESVPEPEIYCVQVDRSTLPTVKLQSSVLKKNWSSDSKTKENMREKQALAKSTEHRENVLHSSTSIDKNIARRAMKRKATSNLQTVDVHAAVNEINTKLALSANFVNNNDSQDKSTRDSLKLNSSLDDHHPEEKTDLDSIDLFFQSMAQTVMTLPPAVQAKIKMDICKVITIAEMKHAA